MAGWPIFVDPDQITQGINSAASAIKASLTDWAASINATSQMTGGRTADQYQELAGWRMNMASWIATYASDINAAMVRRKSGLGSFDAAARWAELEAQVATFLDWIAANWPERSTSGWPAWQKIDPTSKQLVDGVVSLTAGQKSAVLTRINAIITNLPAG